MTTAIGTPRVLAVPRLSDALQRLLAMPEKDRLNSKLLTLIAQKAPGAVVRLLALANSALAAAGSKGMPLTVANWSAQLTFAGAK